MTTTRTPTDVTNDITAKRTEYMSALANLKTCHEAVTVANALLDTLETQMGALATEEAEWRRKASAACVVPLPIGYKPVPFDPDTYLSIEDFESGCGEARPMVSV